MKGPVKSKAIVIFITCSCKKEAQIISGVLLKKRLAACASIAGRIESRFWWNGHIDKADEVMLMCKTTKGHFRAVEKEARRLHAYEVPEIIALPIVAGSASYLRWIRESVARASPQKRKK